MGTDFQKWKPELEIGYCFKILSDVTCDVVSEQDGHSLVGGPKQLQKKFVSGSCSIGLLCELVKSMHMQLLNDGEVIHLSKGNRVIDVSNCKMARGFGKACYLCSKEISEIPYFSHLSGGSHRIHYYHLECARKINFV